MRVLNGAQSSLSYLGVLAGLEHTSDDIADPLLATFVRRMLFEETLPTLEPVPGVSAERYVEQSLERLRNTAIRHRNHQIATDGSQKIVQRLLDPAAERLRRGESVTLLSVPVAAWMVYLDPVLEQIRQELDGRRPLCRPHRGHRRPGRQRRRGAGRRNPGNRYDLRSRACSQRRVSRGDRRRPRRAAVRRAAGLCQAHLRRAGAGAVEAAATNGIVRGMGRRT